MRVLSFFLAPGLVWGLLELYFHFTLAGWLLHLVALAGQRGL